MTQPTKLSKDAIILNFIDDLQISFDVFREKWESGEFNPSMIAKKRHMTDVQTDEGHASVEEYEQACVDAMKSAGINPNVKTPDTNQWPFDHVVVFAPGSNFVRIQHTLHNHFSEALFIYEAKSQVRVANKSTATRVCHLMEQAGIQSQMALNKQ